MDPGQDTGILSISKIIEATCLLIRVVIMHKYLMGKNNHEIFLSLPPFCKTHIFEKPESKK